MTNKIILFVVVLLLVACPAYADMGIPMIAWILPVSWLSLIPIILVEAIVAARLLKKNYWAALKLSTAANTISTIIGIPVTWLLMTFAQMLVGGDRAHGLTTFAQKMYAVTIQSPWLLPYGKSSLRWMFPAAGIFLCVPFFFASVLCEYLVVKKFCDNSVIVKHWSWIANAITYGLIELSLITLLVRILI